MFKHSRKSKGPGHQFPPSSTQPPSAQLTPRRHGALSAASAVCPSHAGQVLPLSPNPSPKPKPQVFNTTSQGLFSTPGCFSLCSMVCFDYPIKSIRKCQGMVQTSARPFFNWRKSKKLGREKLETLVPWAAPAQLQGLLLRSVDHTSVWWHPLTAFSITMALSHLCPSSLSQLNELFPRQIKTGETVFTRGRRLGKGIQMGVMGASGDGATLSAAVGDEGKGKA